MVTCLFDENPVLEIAHEVAHEVSMIVGDDHWVYIQLIGLREKLQENPIFHGKTYGFL